MIFKILKLIWVLPVAIPIWLLYILPVWALGGLVYTDRPATFVIWFTVNQTPKWYAKWYLWLWNKLWGKGGHAMPCAAITNQSPTSLSHEFHHTHQWFTLGPLFIPVFGIGFIIGATRGAAYKMNPLEVEARRATGEKV